MDIIKFAITLLVLPLALSCSGNYLETFADKNTDEALYYTAVEALRSRNYAGAIDSCTFISSAYLQDRKVAVVCASAFAGRCGMEVLDEVDFIATYAGLAVPPPLFTYYLQQLTSTTAQNMSDCHTAESIIRGIGRASVRTSDENLFMVLLALRKMGVYANELADTNEDALMDGGFDACAISDENATNILSAFWELNQSASAMNASYFTNIATAIDLICTDLNNLNPTYNFCSATTFPSSPTVNQLKGARTIMHEGILMGVGSCPAGLKTIANCGCP